MDRKELFGGCRIALSAVQNCMFIDFFSQMKKFRLSLLAIKLTLLYKYMKILKTIISMAALTMGIVACSTEVTPTIGGAENIEVGFAVPMDATRTTIASDGMTTRWASGDKLAVWAKDGNGDFAFKGTTFALSHFSSSYDKAFFTATVPEMAAGDYTYLLSYPQPQSINGTLATYNVSATQSGKYDGKYDIMVAEPSVAGALTSGTNTELNTIMRHEVHALKITIPEGRNHYGSRFYRLEITFPQNVVGDVTLDVSDPTETPVYANMSNVITVENAEGFDVGDDIWVFVLPGTVDGDVSYRVRGEVRHSNMATYPLQRNLQAGHVTPIRMAIPKIYPYYTAVHFSIDQNHLGEEFNYFDVYDANGTHMGKFERNASNKYSVAYEGEFDADQYDNTTWRIVFDSEHAIVETSINLGDLNDYTEHTRWVNVPYLFSEDFSSISSFSHNDNTGAQGTNVSATDISNYGIASGWTGARVGAESNKSIRVGSRIDRVAGYTHTYGRLDSPTMSGLKDGVVINVRVSFNYSGGRNGDSDFEPRAVFGYTTTQGLIDGTTGSFSADKDNWNDIAGFNLVPSISVDGSFSNVTQSMTYDINDCAKNYRLSWQIRGTGEGAFITNGNQWLYIDNVKVQIVR